MRLVRTAAAFTLRQRPGAGATLLWQPQRADAAVASTEFRQPSVVYVKSPPRSMLSMSKYNHGWRRRFSTEVDDDEWTVPTSISIPEARLEFSFVRSSGPGGQAVNTQNSQVQIKLKLDERSCSDWIPDEVLNRLRQQQSNRINKQDELILRAQEYRTQIQNRKAAVDKLQEMILMAWRRPKVRKVKKGLSPEAKEKLLFDKRQKSMKKQNRKRVDF
ncbi:hypothetical protein ACA910_011239 [Epithemia clementina (nom. ined.)]